MYSNKIGIMLLAKSVKVSNNLKIKEKKTDLRSTEQDWKNYFPKFTFIFSLHF